MSIELTKAEAQALHIAFATGHIPRQSFERVLENTLVRE